MQCGGEECRGSDSCPFRVHCAAGCCRRPCPKRRDFGRLCGQCHRFLPEGIPSFRAQRKVTGDGGALLLHEEGVVCAVGGLVLGGQDELAAEKAIRVVVQRSQRTVAKTEKPGVAVSLIALDTLALQVQLGFGSHDGLDIIRFREGVHVHVVDLLAIELVRSHRISGVHICSCTVSFRNEKARQLPKSEAAGLSRALRHFTHPHRLLRQEPEHSSGQDPLLHFRSFPAGFPG